MSKNNLKDERNYIFDLLRIILTVFVINVHIRIITGIKPNFLEPYTWYTVPLFIVLSFFFLSNKVLIVRLKRLFTPFLFWSTIGFFIHPNLFNIKNVFLQILTGHVVNTPLYYLVLLFWFTIINWLINFLSFRIKIGIYLLVILIAFFLEYSGINFRLFYPAITVIEKSYGRFIELIKYVPIGLIFAYLFENIKKREAFYFVALLFLVPFVSASKIDLPPDFHYSGLKTFIGTIIIFSVTLGLSNVKLSNKLNYVIGFFGKYSFGVYLSHYLLLETLLKVSPSIKTFIANQQIVFLFFYILTCYLVCFLFDLLTLKKFSYLIK